MRFNFDTLIDRRGTDAVKLRQLKNLFGKEDLIPLWVADMEFETPPFIREALEERLKHPIYVILCFRRLLADCYKLATIRSRMGDT